MLTKHELDNIMSNFANELKELFGESLKDIILYGSYAREDYDEESDVDVMILVDIENNLLHNYRGLVSSAADKADWNFDTLLSPIMVNNDEFEKYKQLPSFYSNVNREGVHLLV